MGVSASHTGGIGRSVMPGMEQLGRSVGTPTMNSRVTGAKTLCSKSTTVSNSQPGLKKSQFSVKKKKEKNHLSPFQSKPCLLFLLSAKNLYCHQSPEPQPCYSFQNNGSLCM